MTLSNNVMVVVYIGAFILFLLVYSLSGPAKGSVGTSRVWPSSPDQGPLWLTSSGLGSVATTAPKESEKVSLTSVYYDQYMVHGIKSGIIGSNMH